MIQIFFSLVKIWKPWPVRLYIIICIYLWPLVLIILIPHKLFELIFKEKNFQIQHVRTKVMFQNYACSNIIWTQEFMIGINGKCFFHPHIRLMKLFISFFFFKTWYFLPSHNGHQNLYLKSLRYWKSHQDINTYPNLY